MSKKYAVFLTALFCGFISLFVALNALSPDQNFSQQENRVLAQRPKLTLASFEIDPNGTNGSFFSGEFMSDFETYVTDQFVGRDTWISAKALVERALGKTENNGVYLGSRDTLIAKFPVPEAKQVQNNIDYVNKMVDKTKVPVLFALIPGKGSVWSDRLPANAPGADEGAIIATARENTAAQWVDMQKAMAAHADEEIYYRLDHHWTSLGAYYGYAAVAEQMGLEPVPLSAYQKETVTTDFNGTTFSSSGVRWMKPDQIDVYVPDTGVTVQSWRGPQPQEGKLYDESKLLEKDKYAMFMGGNQSLAVVKTAQTQGEKLLIVRDSYADSMVPFLTAHCAEIHLYDPRYNKTPLSEYIKENDIDRVLVMYSVANFVTDSNLFVLGK